MVKIASIKDRLYMPPMKKYEVYGKFPWKIVIQFLLIVSTTSQILLIVNRSTTYSYNQYILWNNLFLNKDVDGSDTSITNSYNLFSINGVSNFVKKTVDRYYDINSYTIDDYDYHYDEEGAKKPPKLLFEFFDNDKALDKGYNIEYKLYNNNLGPFSLPDVQDFMDQVKKFEIHFTLKHKLDKYVNLASRCYEWDIIQKFDYTFHGVIEAKLDPRRQTCGETNGNVMKNYLWVNIVVIILAVASLGTIVNYIHKRIELVSSIAGSRANFNDVSRAWERLRISEKLKFFNFWLIIAIIGNLFQIFGGIISLIDQNTVLTVHEVVVGFGCFFAWIGIIRFLDHDSPSYTVVHTVSRTFETIGLYIIGIIPIFMGYAFLGICSFWQTGIYPNTSYSMLANYAVVNGDSVYAFSLASYYESSFMGQLYFYTFVVFFICCVHNLFIAIVERGFSSLRDNPPVNHGDLVEDEGDAEDKEKKAELNKKKLDEQSKMAFKKILNAGRKTKKITFDENTLNKIQVMDKFVDEILVKAKELINKMGAFKKGSYEYGIMKEHLLALIDVQIWPILEYFS